MNNRIEIVYVPAEKIVRHPKAQRATTEVQRRLLQKMFVKKLGPFQLEKCVVPLQLVPAPGDRKLFYAIDGGTRAELCNQSTIYGGKTKLPCIVHGQEGAEFTEKELSELFLETNTDRINVSSKQALLQSVLAGRDSAVFAVEQTKKLGRQFKGGTGLWGQAKRYGAEPVQKAVDFALATWGKKEHTPSTVIRALIEIFHGEEQVPRLIERQRYLRTKSADLLTANAKVKRGQRGNTESLGTWMKRILLGRHDV